MNKHKKFFLGLMVLAAFFLTGFSPSTGHSVKNPPAQDVGATDVVARVGDLTITLSEFKEKFNVFSRRSHMMSDNRMEREKFLERLVQMSLFSLEARAQEIDKDKRVESQLQDAADRILAGEYFKREVIGKVELTDDEIKDYYETHPREFKIREKVKASHILIKVDPKAKPEEWAMARTRAGELKEQLNKGADFADLAKDNSDDTGTREKGGKLGYFTRGKISQEFSEAAFSLKPGEISEPVRSPKGYHIVKVEAKMPEQIKDLAKVKERIKARLRSERQRAILGQITKGLKEKYKIEMNTRLLNYNEERRPSQSSRR